MPETPDRVKTALKQLHLDLETFCQKQMSNDDDWGGTNEEEMLTAAMDAIELAISSIEEA